MAGGCVAFLLTVLELLVLHEVEGCSCPPEAFMIARSEAIRSEFCSNSGTIYSGVIVEATCSCLPDMEDDTLINCWHYQLLSSNVVNITTLSRGRCDAGYSSGFYTPRSCTDTGPLIASGLTSSGPLSVDLTLQDFSPTCALSCAFNTGFNDLQQCIYTIRVREVFKGTISVDDEIQVFGPDTQTTCGSPSLRLQVGTEYMVGLGSVCSPISEWSSLSMFSSQEVELVRSLQNEGCDSTTPFSTTSTSSDIISTTTESTTLFSTTSTSSNPFGGTDAAISTYYSGYSSTLLGLMVLFSSNCRLLL